LGYDGKPLGPPVIWGDAVKIPAFHLRFVDSLTGELLKTKDVSIVYGWKWLEYPYPEHSWGAWSGAEDVLNCGKIEKTEFSFPQFEVKPRGWYKGKYTQFPFNKKPSFDGITIAFNVAGCHATADIKSKEAKNLAWRTVIVKVASNVHGCYVTKISYERRRENGDEGRTETGRGQLGTGVVRENSVLVDFIGHSVP
jgi:hypothetical protein